MPAEHALLSASAAHRWLHCTPCARLEEQFPDSSSEYAAEGTLAHRLAELKVRKHYTLMAPSTFRKKLKAIQGDALYSPEMLTHTDAYLDYIKDISAAYPSRPYLAIEQRLDYSNIAPEGFGTGDCIVIGGDTLTVIDFKYGKGVAVSAEDNPQMKLYAIGALNAFSLLYNVTKVRLAIFQPRLDSVSEWETTAAELSAWSESIKPIAQQAFEGKGDYCAGDWCRFCRAKKLCRARAAFSQEPYEQYSGNTPPLISAKEVGEILRRADAIKRWVSDLEDWALSEILAGRDVPGWKAVEGRSNRRLEDIDKAFATLTAAGYDEAVLYERKPLSLTALEKLLDKDTFHTLLSPHIIKPQGKPTLAPASDKRNPYQPQITAAKAFEENGGK